MNNSVQDLEIKCANNNTAILFLKQENQRLSNLLTNYHTDIHDTSTSLGMSHHPGSTVSSNDQRSNNNFNKIDYNILNNNNSNLNLYDNSNFLHNNNCNSKLNTLVNLNAITNINNHCDTINISKIDTSDNNTSHNNFKINPTLQIDNGTNISHPSKNLVHTSSFSPVDQLTPLISSNQLQTLTHENLVEKREVFVPGFMKINSKLNMQCISFSILKALLFSLNHSDICGVPTSIPQINVKKSKQK